MSPDFTFPRKARLLNAAEFQRVYRHGLRLNQPPLRCRALRQPEGRCRLGLAVGRKVGGAVVRNRWKRAIREAFRLNRHRVGHPYDLVLSVDWQASPDDVRHVEAAFLRIVESLNEPGRPT